MRSVLPSLPIALLLALGVSHPGPARAGVPSPEPGDAVETPAAVPSTGPAVATPAGPIARLAYEVVRRMPHDTAAWTEGLLFDDAGRLWESTGLTGRSQVREVDPLTGEVLRAADTPDAAYGEGLAQVGDELIQLTWREGRAFRFDRDTLAPTGTFDYSGEGWGLCFDGERLVMSDGSDRLTFRDPATFDVLGQVSVTAGGQPLGRLNELECADGAVWANVWETEWIVRIDPATGAVTGALDADGLLEPDPAVADRGAVLNGIAKVPGADTFLLTGKLWPEAIEVRISEP